MRCGMESHTRPRGASESPNGVDPNIRRTRHNVTVITVGSKYEVYVQSPAPSHMQPLNNPFEPLQYYRCVAVNYSTYICASAYVTIQQVYYVEVLREFNKRFRRKRPAFFKSGQWHFHQDNARPQLHPYHRLFDQDGHQDSSSPSL